MKRKGRGAAAVGICAACALAAALACVAAVAGGEETRLPVPPSRQITDQERWQSRLKLNPNDREALRALAQIALQAGAIKDAIRYVRALAELNPGEPDAWAALAVVSERAGDHDQAIRASQRALALEPGRDDMTEVFVRNVTALNETRISRGYSIGGRP